MLINTTRVPDYLTIIVYAPLCYSILWACSFFSQLVSWKNRQNLWIWRSASENYRCITHSAKTLNMLPATWCRQYCSPHLLTTLAHRTQGRSSRVVAITPASWMRNQPLLKVPVIFVQCRALSILMTIKVVKPNWSPSCLFPSIFNFTATYIIDSTSLFKTWPKYPSLFCWWIEQCYITLSV